MSFELPALPYAQGALEPHISAGTLEFHHGKHHKAYVDNLNGLIKGGELDGLSLEAIIAATSNDAAKVGIFNNAAQAWNHTFYWHSMSPNGGGKPSGQLAEDLIEAFGSYEDFILEFKTAGATQFGSGWVWLVLNKDQLEIVKTANANCPLTDGMVPLLTMDVWEHAYYLDFQNRRPDYMSVFLENLVNWEFAIQNYEAVTAAVAA